MKNRKKIVIGFLGTTMDGGLSDKRWQRWRPTVSLFGHEHFKPDALMLLTAGRAPARLIEQVKEDVLALSPSTQVSEHHIGLEVHELWDFAAVFGALHEFSRTQAFDSESDYYVHLTTGTHVMQICLFLLTESRHIPARLIGTHMKKESQSADSSGPATADFWRGSLEVIDLDLSTYDQLASRFEAESHTARQLLTGGVATSSAAFLQLIERVERVALRSKAPILLLGPSGSGKTVLAKRIHDLRVSRHVLQGPLVEVNCATLLGEGAMSALFGHKRGAFTGAATDRPGLLRQAHGGCLFLDEIAELGLQEQAMLLRALEDKRFTPLGSDKEVGSDFSLIAGTNKDLAGLVEQGLFREDLYARMNIWQFELPPLAHRLEDLPANLEHELAKSGQALGTRVSISSQAREEFLTFAQTHDWPGNFRDFSAVITRMCTLAQGGRITQEDVQRECGMLAQAGMRAREAHKTQAKVGALMRAQAQTADQSGGAHHSQASLLERVMSAQQLQGMDLLDRVQLACVLEAVQEAGSLAGAGRALFAGSRAAKVKPNDSDRVRKMLVSFGLDPQRVVGVLCIPST